MPCEELEEKVLDICKHIAGVREIVAACLYGSRVYGYANYKGDINVLLVLSGFLLRLKTYQKPLNEVNVFILVVDQSAFEHDVEQGRFGEFFAEKITVPYQPFVNKEYLWEKEVEMKKRIVQELLENMVLEYPELSHELLIKAEYFMYKVMKQRAQLFPPITYSYLNMLSDDVRKRNIESIMKGYIQAFKELAEENKIAFSNEHIKITQNFIKTIKKRKLRIPTFFKSLQKAALTHLVSFFPKMTVPLASEEEIFLKTHGERVETEEPSSQLEEPEKYLLMPTPFGLVALSDETTIEDFVRKTVPGGEVLDMDIEKMGGVLNDVYQLRLRKDEEEQRIVVKKFKDWHGFKWFPLALWAVGTKAFAVLGRSRLEREYAINQFLSNKGFLVPKVLYLSPQEGLVFEEFVEGENLVHVIKRIISSNSKQATDVALIKEVGKKIAEVHGLGVAFGDCKPENILVTKEGKLYFVDLEQATRDGNQAWDIAEFLYYSGHYVFPLSSTDMIELMARKFVEGYLEGGGRKEIVRVAGSPRYTKAFSIFTPPHVILAISNLCRKVNDI